MFRIREKLTEFAYKYDIPTGRTPYATYILIGSVVVSTIIAMIVGDHSALACRHHCG